MDFRWCLFFFKQKAAYEIRPRDWSSDVCSSDLTDRVRRLNRHELHRHCLLAGHVADRRRRALQDVLDVRAALHVVDGHAVLDLDQLAERLLDPREIFVETPRPRLLRRDAEERKTGALALEADLNVGVTRSAAEHRAPATTAGHRAADQRPEA